MQEESATADANEGMMHEAFCLIEQGHYKKAADVAKGLRKNGNSPEVRHVGYCINALCWQLRGKLKFAERNFRKALEIYPSSHAWMKLAFVLEEQDRITETIACLKKAIQLDPGNAIALANYGYQMKRKRKYHVAEACLRKAIALDDTEPSFYSELGHVLVRKGQIRNGIQVLAKSIKTDSDFMWSRLYLAYAWILLKDCEQAEQSIQAAIEIQPDYHKAWLLYGYFLYKMRDDLKSVLTALEHARSLNPKCTMTIRLYEICLSKHDRKDARGKHAKLRGLRRARFTERAFFDYVLSYNAQFKKKIDSHPE